MRRSVPIDFEPRPVCPRCERPARVCYCAHLTSIDTTTRVVLLQHPREEGVAIGTARIAHLCLPNSELHVGVDFRDSPALRGALSDSARPAALLYPGEGAVDVFSDPPRGPVTLVVVDGTWWQARKLVRANPELAALPRYAFRAPTPSEYRIRREPDDAYVSTIEALVYVLGVLERDPARLLPLLAPFRAMRDTQIAFATEVRSARHRREPRAPRRPRVAAVLAERPASLVCVTGEANAWPYRSGELRTAHRDELVHWIAHRPATGETLDVIVRPRGPLAPGTPSHVALSADAIEAGVRVPELLDAWRGFVREGDVVCSWGHYAAGIFASAGGELPRTRVDLRAVSRALLRARVGAMDALLQGLGIAPASLGTLGRGRAGVRAAQLARIAGLLGDRVREVMDDASPGDLGLSPRVADSGAPRCAPTSPASPPRG
jgi:DTW domain-containing protein YfiP